MGQNCEGGGSLVTPVHACSHMGTAVHPWEKPKNVKNLIISLALLELSKVSPQIAPPRSGNEAIGTNHVWAWGRGRGTRGAPFKTLLKQEKRLKNQKIVSSQIVPQRG